MKGHQLYCGHPLTGAPDHADMRLYKKAKSIAQPFAYETYRQERIDEKIASER